MHRTGRLKLQITPISLLPAPRSSTIKSPLRQKKKESPPLPGGGGGGGGRHVYDIILWRHHDK